MPLTRAGAQTLSWVLLTLLMLAPRGIEAWLPPSQCPQAFHRQNHCSSFSTSSSLSTCSFWFHTGISVNTCELTALCGSPKHCPPLLFHHLLFHFFSRLFSPSLSRMHIPFHTFSRVSCLFIFYLHNSSHFWLLFHFPVTDHMLPRSLLSSLNCASQANML